MSDKVAEFKPRSSRSDLARESIVELLEDTIAGVKSGRLKGVMVVELCGDQTKHWWHTVGGQSDNYELIAGATMLDFAVKASLAALDDD